MTRIFIDKQTCINVCVSLYIFYKSDLMFKVFNNNYV